MTIKEVALLTGTLAQTVPLSTPTPTTNTNTAKNTAINYIDTTTLLTEAQLSGVCVCVCVCVKVQLMNIARCLS